MILFKQLTVWLASGVEAAAAIVIGLAALEATLRSLLLFLPTARNTTGPAGRQQDAKEAVRLRLGRWLAVALEFELAADNPAHRGRTHLDRNRPARRHRRAADGAELLPATGDRQGAGQKPGPCWLTRQASSSG